MAVLVHAVDRTDIAPLRMPDRFKHDVTYFATHASDLGRAPLPSGEYYIQLPEARTLLEDGVVRIVSPLDSTNRTEIEISEEQEVWLTWIVKHSIEHIRLL